MVRWWAFRQILSGASRDEPLGPEQQQVGGTVDDRRLLGSLALHPPGVDQDAWGEVFADETGGTYWVSTQAPSPMGTGGAIGGSSELLQYQYFRKTDSDAELRLVVSRVFVEAIDGNPGFPTATECHWHQPGASYVDCGRVMWGRVNFRVTAFDFFDDAPFLQTGGFAEITGWRGFFAYNAQTDHDATVPFWDRSRFFFDPDYDDEGGGRAQLVLDAPIAIEVPLSSFGLGDLFYVAVNARAFTLNLRQRESYLSAYFRDPVQSSGLELSFSGLEAVETPAAKPAPIPPTPAPACRGTRTRGAGRLHFSAPAYEAPELPGDGATILVTRSGGVRGAVGATLRPTGRSWWSAGRRWRDISRTVVSTRTSARAAA